MSSAARKIGPAPAPALPTLDELQREARALWDQGLRGEDFVRALGGGDDGQRVVLRTSEELDAWCVSST